MPTVRIPAKLYFDLYSKAQSVSLDADRLIAVYAILKSSRNGQIKYQAYTAKNNKTVSDYALLRAKTNISLNSLKKYVPVLIDLGLCFFDKNGDFVLLGGEKTKELYNSRKLVPIFIGHNLTKTAYNVLNVRLHSSARQQETMIRKNKHRSELIFKSCNPRNLKEYKQGSKLHKKFGDIEVTDNVILSNQGYSALKGNKNCTKSHGQYWKTQLKKNGLVKSSRRFKILEKMPYAQFCYLKQYGEIRANQTYIRGGLAEELCATMVPVHLNREVSKGVFVKATQPTANRTEYTAKPYLQFDFIDFCINGGGREI